MKKQNPIKKYTIEIYYQTGDSFGLEDCYDNLEISWDDIDIAKENLKRIQEHYLWYADKNSRRYKHEPSLKKPSCASDEYDFCLNLKTDAGKEFQYNTFWCGYFDRLYSAKIILNQPNEEGMAFTI